MIEFDANKTAAFFNDVYRQIDIERGKKVDTRLHPRDLIFLNKILNYTQPAECRILDFGCGQGRLLATLLERGYDAEGMEKHDGMRAVAVAQTGRWSKDRARVIAGDVYSLQDLVAERYDVFVAMGVFQYMTKKEYDHTLREITRLLKPSGTLIATYQNALFDLYTFNKYTVDFMMHKLISPHVSAHIGRQIKADIEQLLANPDKPTNSTARARDSIFVHLTNPLTIDSHLASAGLRVQQKYFYEYFGLPPLIADKYDAIAKEIRSKFEVDNATAWQGNFMANAFLVEAKLS